MDTETLRQQWPDVLEAVQRERRVTGILLNSASVASLEGGVLTLAFNRQGEAKGFATSGHDRVLTGVLAAMLGLNVRVRALAGTAAGPRGGGRAGPPDPAAPGGGRTVPADPAAPGGGARDRTGTHGAPRRASRGRDDSPDGPGTPPGGSTSGGVAQGGQGAAEGGGPGRSPEGAGATRRAPSAAPARPTGKETAVPDAPPPAVDYDEEWPDDAGPAGGETGPTGMELIERQLGGTVIEEIEEP
jgi:DNA polymerase-3 subunit gamma/tau